MKVLVTGASGFIGSFLTETLVQQGMEVHCLLRPSSSTQRLRSVLEYIRVYRADLTDPDTLSDAVNAAKPEIIFHLAATGATNVDVSPMLAARINIEGTLNLLLALEGEYQTFVNTGTCHEYGDNVPPFREDQDPRPELPYAITKTAAWRFCNRLYKTKGWPIVTVRPFAVYGPGQAANTFVAACIRAAQSKQNFKMTMGEQSRDWVYIADMVDGLIRAGTTPQAIGGTFNLCTGHETTLYETAQLVAEQIAAEYGCAPIDIHRGALPYREGEIWRLVGDNSRARTVLGWEPSISLRSGIRETVRAYHQKAV